MKSHRIILENAAANRQLFAQDYLVILTWLDGQVLHAALNNYGDDDEPPNTGIDVQEPVLLLQYLISDRFLCDFDRLGEYCADCGVTFVPAIGEPEPDASKDGIIVAVRDDTAHVGLVGWGRKLNQHSIGDWRYLLLALLRDRCEGRDSLTRLKGLLREAGVPWQDRSRGYV